MKTSSNGTDGVSESGVGTSADPRTGRAARAAGGSPAAAAPAREA